MDTSEEYIKMCNCSEIQDKWELKLGQVYYTTPMFNLFHWDQHYDIQNGDGIWSYCLENLHKLPSKEDLQKFIQNDKENLYDKQQAKYIHEWKLKSPKIVCNDAEIWALVNKIRKDQFYIHGKSLNGAFKLSISNANYFWIWLPRQDELQDMLPYQIIAKIKKFCESFNTNLTDSMEQRWLKFVMFELHKLLWSGEKWVKSKNFK